MSGFPTRITANAIGPRMKNRGAVRSPVFDVGADRMNLLRWQVAGLSQAASLVWLLATFTPPDVIAIAAQGCAWQGGPPKLERISPGLYLVTYPHTVLDDDGQEIAMNLLGAAVCARASKPRLYADWDIANGREITVRLFDKTETDTDGSFLLQAY